MLPTAYWVNGDTGMKQTSQMAWDNVFLTAAELAVIVPIPDSVRDDASVDLYGEIKPRVIEEIGKRVDAAVFFGDNRPADWQNDIVTLARQAGNNMRGITPCYRSFVSSCRTSNGYRSGGRNHGSGTVILPSRSAAGTTGRRGR